MNVPTFLAHAADAPEPLFGNKWVALLVILAGVALLMVAIAAVGRWLAATHPGSRKTPVPAQPAATGAAPAPVAASTQGIPPEVLAMIASAVAVTLGSKARIASVQQVKPTVPSVEMLMQQWSVEGRRQIYSSHQIR